MAKFQFSLEPVLRHRNMVEQEQQRALAQLLREKLIIENELRRAQQTISQDKSEMAQQLTGRVDVGRIRQHAAHSGAFQRHIHKLAQRLLDLLKRIEQQRGRLLEATRDRKAVELLRDKRYRQWQQEQRRREASEIDEMTTQAYARRASQPTRSIGVT
jgi:flagellar FliJ protein